MVALQKPTQMPPRHHSAVKRELYRERCQDEDGNRFTVIVWRDWPGLPMTSYTLADGTPVHYDDECYFSVVQTGKALTRCED